MSTQAESFFGPVISSYTREQALKDGTLIELPEKLCKEAGVKIPVAVTDTLWAYINPDYLSEMPGQDLTGRLWDTLQMFVLKARKANTDRFKFEVTYRVKTFIGYKFGYGPERVKILSVIGPGDEGEPVITLMLPGED